jgi:hypothetical protein
VALFRDSRGSYLIASSGQRNRNQLAIYVSIVLDIIAIRRIDARKLNATDPDLIRSGRELITCQVL